MTTNVNDPMPPLGGNDIPEVVQQDAQKTQAKSLVGEMRVMWRKCKMDDRENFLAEPRWMNELKALVEQMAMRLIALISTTQNKQAITPV